MGARKRGINGWRAMGALLAVGVIASLPVATERAGSQGLDLKGLEASAAVPPGQLRVAPDIPFPAGPADQAALAAAKAEAVAALLQKTSEGRLVPVIVGFDAAFVPEGRLDVDDVAAQRASITAVREVILSQLLRGSVGSLKTYQTIPYFAVHADADALRTLGRLDAVTSVVEDLAEPPALMDSTGIIQATQVWPYGVGGAGYYVAILDTGVDKSHSFFVGKVFSEACYSTTSSDSTSVCPGGGSASTAPGSGVNCSASISGCDHGTHVAGIAAGKGTSFSGVARDANLIAIQVFSRFDSEANCGSSTPCVLSYISDQLLALERVLYLSGFGSIASVNMSLASGKYTSEATCDAANGARKAAIDNLRSVGVATIIASGNDGYSDGISAPACISSAVAVGSTTKGGVVSSFSNQHPTMVDLMAPGSSIYSSVPGQEFSFLSGTSMAAPHVAGAWALLKRVAALKGRMLSVTEGLTALRQTGRSVLDAGAAGSGGTFPEVRVFDAAVLIYNGGGGSAPGAPSGLTGSSVGSSAQLHWTAPATGGVPTAYTIEAGSAPGLANLANFSTGSTATSYSTSGVAIGTYYVRVLATNAAGASAPSNEVIVTIPGVSPDAPIITTHPTSQSVAAGSSVTFSAAASGTPAPTVQWQTRTNSSATFADISGATATSYTVTATAADDGRQFRAVFTNSAGTATTNIATLTVGATAAPIITTHPASQNVAAGSSVTFSAAAGGTPTPTVQWQSRANSGATFADISGATASNFILTATAADDGRQFRAVFTNSAGTAATNVATLGVLFVALHPANQSVAPGSTATFSAAAGGTPTPTVQWQVSINGGASFANISGATAASYSFTVVASDNGKQFRAVFSISGGSVTTNAATLTVLCTSPIAPTITLDPVDAAAAAGSQVSFSASADGCPTPTVQWQSRANSGAAFADIGGAVATSYAFTVTAADDGRQFRAVFTNSAGTATTNTATFSLQVAPSVTLQPTSQSVAAGSTATFSAAASGTPAPTVQWQLSTDGGTTFTNISGATAGTYSFATAASDNGKRFRAVFTNIVGTATTNAVTLSISVAPAVTLHPTSQSVAAGSTATFSAAASGTPTPTVQWQVSTDSGVSFADIGGATTGTYSVTTIAADNGKRFRAVFTNLLGSATTNAAVLTVY